MVTASTPKVISFEAFYRSEYRAMVALAAAVSGNGSVAEDIAQEGLARAHREWQKICDYDKPGAWLRRVVIRLASNVRRSGRRQATALKLIRPNQTVELELPDPDVWKAVRSLPAQQRAAIALFYLEDRSLAEIAEILGCAENTAKAHLHHGRRALAARLETHHA